MQKCTDCGVYHLHVGPVPLRLRRVRFDNRCALMARLQVTGPTRTALDSRALAASASARSAA